MESTASELPGQWGHRQCARYTVQWGQLCDGRSTHL